MSAGQDIPRRHLLLSWLPYVIWLPSLTLAACLTREVHTAAACPMAQAAVTPATSAHELTSSGLSSALQVVRHRSVQVLLLVMYFPCSLKLSHYCIS